MEEGGDGGALIPEIREQEPSKKPQMCKYFLLETQRARQTDREPTQTVNRLKQSRGADSANQEAGTLTTANQEAGMDTTSARAFARFPPSERPKEARKEEGQRQMDVTPLRAAEPKLRLAVGL